MQLLGTRDRDHGVPLCGCGERDEVKSSFICEIFVTISRAKSPVKAASQAPDPVKKRAPGEWWRQYNDSIYFVNAPDSRAQIAPATLQERWRPMADGVVFAAGEKKGTRMPWCPIAKNCFFGHGDAFFILRAVLPLNL